VKCRREISTVRLTATANVRPVRVVVVVAVMPMSGSSVEVVAAEIMRLYVITL
jgi:hypothetical protein